MDISERLAYKEQQINGLLKAIEARDCEIDRLRAKLAEIEAALARIKSDGPA